MKKGKPDISYGLWLLLTRVLQLITNARRKELNKYGMTIRQYAIVRNVVRMNHQATPTTLAKESHMDLSSVSEQLTRMEKKGLIKKVKDLDRKNMVRIEVTDKGLELYSSVKGKESIKSIISMLGEKDKRELWRILSQLRETALHHLGIENAILYPTESPEELWEDDFI